jgi:hypothetical protein
MIKTFPKTPKALTTDLTEFDSTQKSLYISASVKNLEKLRDLQIDNLWVIGAKENNLEKILSLTQPKYLNLYQVLAGSLKSLELLTNATTIVLQWNTKSEQLWDFTKNICLKTLSIIDFSKLHDISQLGIAKQLDNLILEGGIDKKIQLLSLKPISELQNLRYLRLANLKVTDDTLKYLADLKKLEELFLSNQFETKEYAWLATRLHNTQCDMFKAANQTNLKTNFELPWDTMITGRRKPFLHSVKDKIRIEKYIADFEKFKNDLS